MKWFNIKALVPAFAGALSLATTLAFTVIVDTDDISGVGIFLTVIVSILASVALAAILSSYKIPYLAIKWVYRGLMRRLAKRAIRSSLSHTMTPMSCLGILNRQGTVVLRVSLVALGEVELGLNLNVYDTPNGQLWGRVRIVEVGDSAVFCEPFDRINQVFWERLEDRMNHDTSPPSVYLIREIPAGFLEIVERLLDGWR